MRKISFTIVFSLFYVFVLSAQSQNEIDAAIEFCKSEYQGNEIKSTKTLNLYVIKFMLAQKVLANSSDEIKSYLVKKQEREFPKLRKLYVELLNEEMAEFETTVEGDGLAFVVNSRHFRTKADAMVLHEDKDFAFMYKALNFTSVVYVSDHSPVHVITQLSTKGDSDLTRYLLF